MSKPKVIKVYDKLDDNIKEKIKLHFHRGFEKGLITFKNAKNKLVSALPFEAEDRYYLVRMSRNESQKIVREDDDYDATGNLTREVKLAYEEKYKNDAPKAE